MAQRLVLVGGGHAHVAVLADWILHGVPAGAQGVLLTPERHLRYSGMVPGWMAGQHGQDEGRVDLAALAERAGFAWMADRCTSLAPAARVLRTAGGAEVAFDLASLGTGGEGRAAALLGDDPRLIDVRPISAFVAHLAVLRAAQDGSGRGLSHVVVAGGGAGGVELAFAMRNLAGAKLRPNVTLVAGAAGVLPGFAPSVRARTQRALARQGIAVLAENVRIAGGAIRAESQSLEPADLIIAALGSAAPAWLRASGLAVDAAGFALVDAQHRSVSHPHIFAAGDIAVRADRPLAHSGVHAVFAGPVLAANLRSVLTGQPPRAAYRPRWNNLYLMNTGDGSAIASYGRLAAEGPYLLALKHWIDKRWIAKYAALAKAE